MLKPPGFLLKLPNWIVQPGISACLLLFLAGTANGQVKLSLRGEIHLETGEALRGQRAVVVLRGAHRPFHLQTRTDRGGRFRFDRLSPGVYVLASEITGLGSARTSVDVTAALADSKGRIHRVLTLKGGTAAKTSQVSLAELSIPKRAWESYAKAERLLGKGRVDQPIALLEKTVAKEPGFVHAINTLGTIAYHHETSPGGGTLDFVSALTRRDLDVPQDDPADRFIAATAITRGLTLVTSDRRLLDCPQLQDVLQA